MSYTASVVDRFVRENGSKEKIFDRGSLDFLANLANNYVWKVFQNMRNFQGSEVEKLTNSITSLAQGYLVTELTYFKQSEPIVALSTEYTTQYAPKLTSETREYLAASTEVIFYLLTMDVNLVRGRDDTETIKDFIRKDNDLFALYQNIKA